MDARDRVYQVKEVFYSLQGEGPSVGLPAVFVRFAGCNFACPFCDTDHEVGLPMTRQGIVDEAARVAEPHGWAMDGTARVVRLRCVLTGGEPLLQVDEALVAALAARGFRTCVETNGSQDTARIAWERGIDLDEVLRLSCEVVISPKRSDLDETILAYGTALKVLVPFPNDVATVLRAAVEDLGSDAGVDLRNPGEDHWPLFLQPITPPGCSGTVLPFNLEAAMVLAAAFARYGEQWRVLPQVHRLAGLR